MFTFANNVFGSGDQRNVRNWCSASGLSSGLISRVARIALISEPKTNVAGALLRAGMNA